MGAAEGGDDVAPPHAVGSRTHPPVGSVVRLLAVGDADQRQRASLESAAMALRYPNLQGSFVGCKITS